MDILMQQLTDRWIPRAQSLKQFLIGIKQSNDRGKQNRFEINHPMLNGMFKSEWMNQGDVFIARPFEGERVRDGQVVPSVLTGTRTTEAPGLFSELSNYGAVVEEVADLERLRRGLPCKSNIFSISRTPSMTQFELHGVHRHRKDSCR